MPPRSLNCDLRVPYIKHYKARVYNRDHTVTRFRTVKKIVSTKKLQNASKPNLGIVEHNTLKKNRYISPGEEQLNY